LRPTTGPAEVIIFAALLSTATTFTASVANMAQAGIALSLRLPHTQVAAKMKTPPV
jgi:hypothetical protein